MTATTDRAWVFLTRKHLTEAEMFALRDHILAIESALDAAGYVPAGQFGEPPGYVVSETAEADGAHVYAMLPLGLDGYPGYRVALERAGYSVTPHPIHSIADGAYLHTLWFVPLPAPQDTP